MKDDLSLTLGAFELGEIEYSYLDAVKLAGHSCPTVASIFAMLKVGLNTLYPTSTPKRGEIKVGFKDKKEDNVTGVMANIATLICGCGDDGGFKGINGMFSRKNLLYFDSQINNTVKLTRLDNNQSIELKIDLSTFPDVNPSNTNDWQNKVNSILKQADKIVTQV